MRPQGSEWPLVALLTLSVLVPVFSRGSPKVRHEPEGALLILPGRSVGPLKLGDTRDRVGELFPYKKGVDQEFEQPGCGTEYLWVDLKNPRGGNVFIRLKEGRVFQIESATSRYRTVEGLSVYSSPKQIRKHYKNLKAYALLNKFSEALGGGPLIFWVDYSRGIAFAFAAERHSGKRYLYEIVVFKAASEFCPMGTATSSPDWQELKPYSLELPGRD